MVGYGPAMQRVFTLIRRLAHHARVVLVEGETGTGKELVARALHEAGERRTAPFITINCSAVTGANFESELFGHEAGAFPGAVDMKRGLFEAAAGGTLFLDEVGELPLPAQARLLRVLESGEIQRLGTLEVIKVDVTIVAATSRDLHREVEAGRFRSDLFHRLTVTGVALPPLRERREDIPYLTAAFLREASRRFNKTVTGLSVGAEYLLQQSNWPGNVRELRNTIERAVLLTNESVISEREIWRAVGKAPDLLPVPPVPVSSPRPGARAGAGPGRQAPDDQERTLIVETLRRVRGNRMAAARLLGISRRSLYRRLERYQIVDAPQPVERHV